MILSTHDIDASVQESLALQSPNETNLAIESRIFLAPRLDPAIESVMIIMMDKGAKTLISEHRKKFNDNFLGTV